jgi:hypothetical protein
MALLQIIAKTNAAGASTTYSFGLGYGRLLDHGLPPQTMWGPDKTRGDRETQIATARVYNGDGENDAAVNYAFDGQLAQISSAMQFGGTADQPDFEDDAILFYIKDRWHNFRRPMLTTLYAGTNVGATGLEGTANDIKGQVKPCVLGISRNVTPKFVNTSLLAFQFDGLRGLVTGGTITVYDKGVALVQGADYANQADLEATAPAAGQFRVWKAGGCFRLGSTPTGAVTCDVTNPATTNGTSNTWSTTSANAQNCIMAEVLYYAYLGTIFAGCDIEADFIDTPAPGTTFLPDVGLYVDTDESYLSVLNRLKGALSMRFSTVSGLDGDVYLARQCNPSSYVAAAGYTFTEHQMLAEGGNKTTLRRVRNQDDDRGVPAWRVNVYYQKNYTVQGQTDLAGSASQAQIAFASQEWRLAFDSDATIKTQWANAVEINVYTHFDTEAAALAEAQRLLAIYKVRRDMFEADGDPIETSLIRLNKIVELTHGRWALSAGKNFQVIAAKETMVNGYPKMTYTFWG